MTHRRSPGRVGTNKALAVEDMMAATGWQAHSVRSAMSGALKKKLGLVIESEKAAGGRVYRIIDGSAGAGG
ncbi:MAG TPA: DUF3489 domain-containing protein [Caulobacteraceae bacterium]|nr:DUF3489 domain-containing protein [Caulobacteraceae bacterium]